MPKRSLKPCLCFGEGSHLHDRTLTKAQHPHEARPRDSGAETPQRSEVRMSRTFRATTAVVALGAFFLGGTNADASVKIAWAAKNPTLEVNALGAAESQLDDTVRRQAPRQGCPHGRAPLRGGRKGSTSLHAAEPSACRSGRWSGRPRTGRSGRCSSGAASGASRSSFASRAGRARRPASRFAPSAASGEASKSKVRRASTGGRSTATTIRRPASRSTSTGGTCTSTRFATEAGSG